MNSRIFLLSILLGLISSATFCQAIRPEHFDDWHSIKSQKLSKDGAMLLFEAQPLRGDGFTTIINLNKDLSETILRGSACVFGPNSDYVICKVKHPFDTIQAIKLAKQNNEKYNGKKAEVPTDSAVIYIPGGSVKFLMPKVKSFAVPKDSSSVLLVEFQVEKKKESKSHDSKKKKKKKKKKQDEKLKDKKKPKASGLVIWDTEKVQRDTFKQVVVHEISANGATVGMVQLWGEKPDSSIVLRVDLSSRKVDTLFNGNATIKNIKFDDLGQRMVFMMSTDTTKKKNFDLYVHGLNGLRQLDLADTNLPYASEHQKPYFSDDGRRLFFGLVGPQDPEQKDSTLKEDRARLDLWSWTDERLQPHQLKQLKSDENSSYLSYVNLDNMRVIQLADDTVDAFQMDHKKTAKWAIGMDPHSYGQAISWDWPWYRKFYRINMETGERTLMADSLQYSFRLSLTGKYFLWYDARKRTWLRIKMDDLSQLDIGKNIPTPLWNIEHNTPNEPYPYGIDEFTEDDKEVLIRDEFDLWKVDLESGETTCYTDSSGRRNNIKWRAYNFNREDKFLDLNQAVYLSGFDETNKTRSVFRLAGDSIEQVIQYNGSISWFDKAENGEVFSYRKYSYRDQPEVFSGNLEGVEKSHSDLNPIWDSLDIGTVEMVDWVNGKGEKLEGLLYKPAGFSADKKYPMIVYFYERNSDNLHRFWKPQPTASIIYPSYYASNGYVVFIPDIVYGTGTPGADATDCIVSGTKHILNMGFVDPRKVGIQGQSWGGYQTAFVITQTNMFAAAMAGAPVSNMTSAYGGIRWGSGFSRMFQYEKTQSRLGATLWEDRGRYIANSPVFFADKITTPLLIMHNDKDGAVPWYQGIEFFVAMRRLQKPAWMLNYNDDAHNLKRIPNKKDLSIRMEQFFNHYLKDDPAPRWMTEGIRAVEKGKDYKLELMDK